jgi:hypothetical protein
MKIVPFLGFLLLSEVAAVALFVFCLMVLHFNPFGFNVNLILSTGGMVFGLIAGSGSLPGAKRSGIAPSLGAMVFVALVTGAAVLVYHYTLFAIFLARLGPAGSGLGFGDFLDVTVGHTRFSAHYSSTSSDIGKWGYGLFALHIVWAMLMSGVWLTRLRKMPHCGRCGRYFEEREKRELMFASPDSLQELALSLPKPSAERAAQLLKMPQTPRYAAEAGVGRLEIRHAQCPGCGEHDATETVEIHNGKTYTGTETHSYRWKGSGTGRAAPAEQAPQPAASQPRGFGRRGLG